MQREVTAPDMEVPVKEVLGPCDNGSVYAMFPGVFCTSKPPESQLLHLTVSNCFTVETLGYLTAEPNSSTGKCNSFSSLLIMPLQEPVMKDGIAVDENQVVALRGEDSFVRDPGFSEALVLVPDMVNRLMED